MLNNHFVNILSDEQDKIKCYNIFVYKCFLQLYEQEA